MTQPAPTLRSRRLRALLLMFVLGCLVLPLGGLAAGERVTVLDIDGTITPTMAFYVERGIRQGNDDTTVTAIVLRVNTPGGLSSAMDDIVDAILQSGKPVIVYVAPSNARAASAGVYITYAGHIAAMAPGTNIGSASPVNGDGTDIGETMQRKVMNDAVARIRNLAQLRDRNADWAESAVRDAVNIGADEALELGVIDYVAPDLPTLLSDIDGARVTMANGETVPLSTAGATITTVGMNPLEQLLQLITDPTIAYMLMSLGSLGIFLELSNPGGWVPGTVGVAALILALYGLGTLPVDWTGALLIGLGFGLFFIDIFVSSLGILTVGGLVSFVIGSYMLIRPGTPGFERVATPVIWTTTLLIAGSAVVIGWLIIRGQRRRPFSGRQALVGSVAEVRSALAPEGMVYVNGEYWSARVAGEVRAEPQPGDAVEVVAVHGLKLTVTPSSRPVDRGMADIPEAESLVPVR